MVCLGNICRSPLAEGILRHKLELKGIFDISVDSAGTSDYHVGDAPDPRSIKNAKSHGIDISHLRGRQFIKDDFRKFDLIYAMDSSNFQNVIALAENKNDAIKVDLLLNAKWPGKNISVPDPYYGAGDGFENVFLLVEQACDEIVNRIIKKNKI
ncbi:low molecular weight protein-tyrosine-phosphatase [soil metagenome]